VRAHTQTHTHARTHTRTHARTHTHTSSHRGVCTNKLVSGSLEPLPALPRAAPREDLLDCQTLAVSGLFYLPSRNKNRGSLIGKGNFLKPKAANVEAHEAESHQLVFQKTKEN
jgi:hypothetical protein